MDPRTAAAAGALTGAALTAAALTWRRRPRLPLRPAGGRIEPVAPHPDRIPAILSHGEHWPCVATRETGHDQCMPRSEYMPPTGDDVIDAVIHNDLCDALIRCHCGLAAGEHCELCGGDPMRVPMGFLCINHGGFRRRSGSGW